MIIQSLRLCRVGASRITALAAVDSGLTGKVGPEMN